MAQMKLYKERKTRKAKAKACLFAAVSPSILIKIMKIDSTAEIWEYLKEEYKGDERIKNMKVMNLIREFEMKKMKESDAVKDYGAQLLSIADKDLSTISLTELLHSLEAAEQRRLMRQGDTVEGAFQARMQKNACHKNGKMNNNKPSNNNKKMEFFHLVLIARRQIILHKNVGGDQM
ncbi:hypothetical protein CK203_098921 [Vitis vinifera]|uniref:Retrovirus-related Pol polyprotein from transposon TNT 1-94 n=1 Tax=Vitis vinifera TaxID=29760 RepID=A0A438CJU1_VITVI|nr:hypothetical protein CK203_098921 [Vitis vinifera]